MTDLRINSGLDPATPPDRPTTTDSKVVLAVTAALALMAIVGLVGIIWLTADDNPIPDALTAITSAAAGALGALLARTSVA